MLMLAVSRGSRGLRLPRPDREGVGHLRPEEEERGAGPLGVRL